MTNTRACILRAALRLFPQHGDCVVGSNDTLALAEAPEGSMQHHLQRSKEEIAMAVVVLIAGACSRSSMRRKTASRRSRG